MPLIVTDGLGRDTDQGSLFYEVSGGLGAFVVFNVLNPGTPQWNSSAGGRPRIWQGEEVEPKDWNTVAGGQTQNWAAQLKELTVWNYPPGRRRTIT